LKCEKRFVITIQILINYININLIKTLINKLNKTIIYRICVIEIKKS
jgi:hypothetical protein